MCTNPIWQLSKRSIWLINSIAHRNTPQVEEGKKTEHHTYA